MHRRERRRARPGEPLAVEHDVRADEGVSFEAVLDALRQELALRYLATPATAIGEVAYLLGYSEPSAFHRAFKRWSGKTPAEARASR